MDDGDMSGTHQGAELLPIGVFRTDALGRCIYADQQWCALTGLSLERSYGLGWADALHDDDRERVVSGWRRAVRAGSTFHTKYRIRHVSGLETWVHVQAFPEVKSGGGILGYVGTITDITRQIQDEEALRESEERFRAIAEAIPIPVLIVSLDGEIVYANGMAGTTFGVPPEHMISRSAREFYQDPEDRQMVLAELKDSGLIRGREHRFRRADGTPFWAVLTARPLIYNGRRAILSGFYDITGRRRLEVVANLMSEVDHRILQGDPPDTFLPFLCARLSEVFVCPMVWVGTREADGSISRRTFHSDPDLSDIARIEVRWDDTPAGQGPSGLAVRSGRTQIVDPLIDDSTVYWRDRVDCHGIRTVIAVPLKAAGEVLGNLSLHSRQRDAFGTEEIQLIESVAERLSVSLMVAAEQRRQRLLSAATDLTTNAVFITDRDGRIEWVNPAFIRLTGYRAEEAVGRTTPRLLGSDAHDKEFYRGIWDTMQRGETWRGEIVARRKDGILLTVDQTTTPLRDETGEIQQYVFVVEDITDQKHAKARIEHLAYHDALTELPNRVLFQDRLHQAIAAAERRPGGLVAVHFLDLDDFKAVNDTLGHAVGDVLLKAVAERLLSCVRESDTVARFGGDEFAIVQTNVVGADDAATLARRLVAGLAEPFSIGEHEFRTGVSIGISLFPLDSRDADQLAKNADMAMYRAKDEGRGSYRFFSSEMSIRLRERMEIAEGLREALADHDGFLLHFQPQIDLATGEVAAIEALLRWRPEPGAEPVAAARFLSTAQETGLIIPIGERTLHTACRYRQSWQRHGVTVVAVHLCDRQLHAPDLVETIRTALSASGLSGDGLEIEIVESSLSHNPEAAAATLRALRDLGITITLDAFGTGYCSLGLLRHFPIGKLKIHAAFVAEVERDRSVVRAAVGLGHGLGMRVVAEGVETEAQLRAIIEENCDGAQGHYFSPPQPAEQLPATLQDLRARLARDLGWRWRDQAKATARSAAAGRNRSASSRST